MARYISLPPYLIKDLAKYKLEDPKVCELFYNRPEYLIIHVTGTNKVIIKTNEKTNLRTIAHRSMAAPVLAPFRKTDPAQGNLFPE